MKIKIGVIPLYDTKEDALRMNQDYLNALIDLGAMPYIIPFTSHEDLLKNYCDEMDGFLFTGGPDINPKLYGEEIKEYCKEICSVRDEEEVLIYNIVKNMDKPILGICRGHQFLNVMRGGTLYQDIDTEVNRKNKINHKQEKPYYETRHKIYIEKDSFLYRKIGADCIKVNSIHHQGIKNLGKGLKVNAVSEDGIIEGFEDPLNRFFVGVQWHPEYLYKKIESCRIIFKEFIDCCRK
ncbi:MAG: gamma-glutamyl-gamma-aminobutyrate hydrolase family protein [Clostridiales bacterium]|nr:gamma-glutamyl-gamma-aminobutyrate hydrolase family protein [Clostridiales bacterium]